MCKPDFYDADATDDGIDCQRCTVGMNCEGVGAALLDLPVLPGYFRVSNTSTDVRRCPDASAGCDGSSECVESISGCAGTNTSHGANRTCDGGGMGCALCHKGLTGVYCQQCVDPAHYYVSMADGKPATCKPCEDSLDQTIGLGAGALLIVLLLCTGLRLCWLKAVSQAQKEVLKRWMSVLLSGNQIKIAIGFYMIATKIDNVYEVGLPEDVIRFLDSISVVLTFALKLGLEATPLECLGLKGHTALVAFWTIVPLFVACMIVLGVSIWMRATRGRERLHDRSNDNSRVGFTSVLLKATPLLLRLLFLAYPIVTQVAFETFSFHTFDEATPGEVSWLRADVRIKYGSPEYREARAAAMGAILLYPVGALLLCAALLFYARGAIKNRHETPLSKAIYFLHDGYEPHLFW